MIKTVTRTLAATALLATASLAAAPEANACWTALRIQNNSDSVVKVISFATNKQGKNAWKVNMGNTTSAVAGAYQLDPQSAEFWPLGFSRKNKTTFAIRVYYVVKDGPSGMAYSNYAKCGNSHSITIN